MATASQRLQFLLSVDAKGAVKGFEDTARAADRELRKVDEKFDQLGSKFTSFGAGALAAAGVALGGLATLATSASDLDESINAVEVTYGEAAAAILAQSKNAAAAVGLPKSEFNNLAVSFKGFADQISGQDGTTVDTTIGNLMQRVADFASVMNLDIPEAAGIFQSALAGQTEPLRRFGIDVGAAATKQFALETGIIDTDRELTESEKTYARYKLIMSETATAAGDFANTSDSLANKQRVLRADFENLKADIGAGVIPIFETLLGKAQNVVNTFGELDEATQGAAGQVLGFGTIALGAVGGVSLLVGQAIKARRAFILLNSTLAKNPYMLAALAIAAIGTELLLTKEEGEDATEALSNLGGVTEDLRPLVDLFRQLSEVRIDNLSPLTDLDVTSIDGAADGVINLTGKLLGFKPVVDIVGGGLENLIFGSDETANAMWRVEGASDGAARGIGAVRRAQEEAEPTAEELAEALEEETEALEDAAEAARDQESAINDMADAQRSSVDSAFAVRRAQQDFKEQLDETNAAIESGELSAEQQQIALDDLALSAADVADAQVALAEAQAEANGKTLTGSERTAAFNESLIAQAAQASGPTRQAIIDYMAEVNNIPESKASEIQALIDQGKLDEATALLNGASATRNAQMNAEATTEAAENALNNVARPRSVSVTPVVRPHIISGTLPSYIHDALNRHVGGRVSPGDMVQPLSGEMFVPDQPGRIVSREDTSRMLEAGSQRSGVTVNVTVNNPRSEDDVRRAVSRALALAELQQ